MKTQGNQLYNEYKLGYIFFFFLVSLSKLFFEDYLSTVVLEYPEKLNSSPQILDS